MKPPRPDWSRSFDDPITLRDGRQIVTLRDAGETIAALPAKEQHQAHWRLAIEMLLMVAEGRGPLMFAHIAMLRALHHGRPEPEPQPRKKRAKAYRIIR